MRVKLRGEVWKVSVLPADEFAAAHGDSCAAITLADIRTLVFPFYASLQTVRHEVFHAYVSTLYLENAEGLSIDQAEELIAGLISECWDDMNRVSRRIFKQVSAPGCFS